MISYWADFEKPNPAKTPRRALRHHTLDSSLFTAAAHLQKLRLVQNLHVELLCLVEF